MDRELETWKTFPQTNVAVPQCKNAFEVQCISIQMYSKYQKYSLCMHCYITIVYYLLITFAKTRKQHFNVEAGQSGADLNHFVG